MKQRPSGADPEVPVLKTLKDPVQVRESSIETHAAHHHPHLYSAEPSLHHYTPKPNFQQYTPGFYGTHRLTPC